MKLGVIADDFTGASDIALTLAEGGMATAQFIGVPGGPAPQVEAGVVALKIRTEPVANAVAQARAACAWLRAQGATQIIYKVCSTFDSTPTGNIGPVSQALAEDLGETSVLVCPAFPENGRSVYMGHLFVADQLLSDSGMAQHPLTPMTDADLRRVLAPQTNWPVGHIPAKTVWAGVEAVKTALDTPGFLIADAVQDADLITLGAALKDRKLLTGGSGIALGLPANFGCAPAPVPWEGQDGPGAILSGSCSIATREQIARYSAAHPAREVTAQAILTGTDSPETLADWAMSQTDPLIYSSADPQVVKAVQAQYGQEASAAAIEGFFAQLARLLVQRGVTRLVSAGGETSGAVTTALDPQALTIGPRIAAGVPALRVTGQPLTLALKSGNFGGPDFFAEALALLKGTP